MPGFAPEPELVEVLGEYLGSCRSRRAMALPAAFLHRDLILQTAFAVVLGTLMIEGLTLTPLLAEYGKVGRASIFQPG